MLDHLLRRCKANFALLLLALLAACGAEAPPREPGTVPTQAPLPEETLPLPPPVKEDPPLEPPLFDPSAGEIAPGAPREEYAKVEVFYATDRTRVVPGRRWYLTRFVWGAAALAVALLLPLRLRRYRVWGRRPVRIAARALLFGFAAFLLVDGLLAALRMSRKVERLAFVYSGDPDVRRGLEYGSCVVSVPPRHRTGEVETPSIFRGELFEDPYRHMVLWSATPGPRGPVFERIRERVKESGQEDAFVFIHGYNVTFEWAAMRTAQIAWDLEFRGAPIFFSWSSQGDIASYTHDEDKARDAVPRLAEFLLALHADSGAKKIYLVAHSMGTRVLGDALVRIAERLGDRARLFHEVILAAPDINADTFRQDIAPLVLRTSERVTLYASSNDSALVLSEKIHGSARAGSSGDAIVVLPGMDTIDVSGATAGHCYLGTNGRVLNDLRAILLLRKKAQERSWLEPRDRGADRYWYLATVTPR